MMLNEKKQLRTLLRKKRNALSRGEIHAYSHSAMTHFVHSDIFLTNQHFACYLAADHEIETQLFIEHIFQHKKQCYLPRLEQDHMIFAHYDLGDPLTPNQFNILEPTITQRNHRDAKKMDVILTPLVGFDSKGHRLGMGGGFYDRTLESVKRQAKPIIIGLAFECQRIEAVPTEAWDIPLDAILTEHGLEFFSLLRKLRIYTKS